jgi:predicted dinucleotide-binding enzyme
LPSRCFGERYGRCAATALDVGDLRQARHLEAMGVVIVRLLFTGHGLNSVFQFVEAAP